jgi:prefoldin subunit 5
VATIQTAIRLTDGMTTPLHNIVNALNHTIAGFQNMQSTASQSINTSSLDAAKSRINSTTMALNELETAGQGVNINIPSVTNPALVNSAHQLNLNSTNNQIQSLQQNLRNLRSNIENVPDVDIGVQHYKHQCPK